MNIKLIALDLDGTTLTSANTLSPVVAAAIERAADAGIEIVAASGRPYASMPQEVLRLRGVNYTIASNGAAIYDRTGKRIHESLLQETAVMRLLELTEGEDHILEAFLAGETYTDNRYLRDPTAYGCTEAYVPYVQNSRAGLDDMRRYIRDNRTRLDSVEIVCPDKRQGGVLRQRLAENLSGVYITSSSPHFVEVMDEHATKSHAVSRLCARLHIPAAQTAACGNADNDADMIAAAGLKTCVANASESCKAAAGLVLPGNDQNGVADLIQIILQKHTAQRR